MGDIKISQVISMFSLIIYLGLGIASCVVYAQNHTSPPLCGVNGSPPLQQYVLGAGIAFLIISVGTIIGLIVIPVLIIIALCGGGFCFAWMIVGSVSLFRDGADCQSLNYPIWAVAMAIVICSYIMFGIGLINGYVRKQEKD